MNTIESEIFNEEPGEDEDKTYNLNLTSRDKDLRINIRWDGCCNIYSYANSPYVEGEERDEPCDCYLHICSIDEWIGYLQEVKRLALCHFKDGWEA